MKGHVDKQCWHRAVNNAELPVWPLWAGDAGRYLCFAPSTLRCTQSALQHVKVTLTLSKDTALSNVGLELAENKGKRKNGVFAVFMGATVKERTKHIVVTSVRPDLAAAAAGFVPGDELLSFDGEPIESIQQASGLLEMAAQGPHAVRVLRHVAVPTVVVGKVVAS